MQLSVGRELRKGSRRRALPGPHRFGDWRSPCGDWPAVPLSLSSGSGTGRGQLSLCRPRVHSENSALGRQVGPGSGALPGRGSAGGAGTARARSWGASPRAWHRRVLAGGLRGWASGPWFPNCFLPGPPSTPPAVSGRPPMSSHPPWAEKNVIRKRGAEP